MMNITMDPMMEAAIKFFDGKLDQYEEIEREIAGLEYDLNQVDENIREYKDHVTNLVAQLQNLIDSADDTKAKLAQKIYQLENLKTEMISEFAGTIIKESEDEKVERFSKPARNAKVKLPCSNHTYKDMRFLQTAERKHREKQVTQKFIQEAFETSYRNGFPGEID